MAIPVKLKRSGTTTATPSSLEYGEIAINYADGVVFYRDSSDVIQSFTFQAYALASHTHAASDITSGTLDAARLPLATTGAVGGVIVGTGLGVSSGTVSVTYGTTAGTACQGNDSRLSDARTPTDGSVTTAKIADDAVTYAKIQNVSTTDRLLGRSSAGAGDVEEITCTAFGRSLIDDADAAAARTTLGAAPLASPTFTGTVTVPGLTATAAILADDLSSANSVVYSFDGDPNTGIGRGGADSLTFVTNGSEQMRVDANGHVGIGATPSHRLHVAGATDPLVLLNTIDSQTCALHMQRGNVTKWYEYVFSTDDSLRFGTPSRNPSVVFDTSGNVLVGTTNTDPVGGNVEGVVIGPSYVQISRSGDLPLLVNRKTNDGDLVGFWQDGTFEGSISVSGNTVSYNAFCGSHWAQLIDGSRPAILRGTVLETIDEMCEWPDGKSDRLPRVKVSDTPRSRRVYGVFMAWDEDYASTGDMYATALGAYMVRVSGVVQSGDLLESAGDGTARTQSDDIVRSSTIGKVSSTHRVAEYDDGSYLVPCVLMCG